MSNEAVNTPMKWQRQVVHFPPTPDPTPPSFERPSQQPSANFIQNHPLHYLAQPIRHRKKLRDNLKAAICQPVIRRLARRGGVRRIQKAIYQTIQQVVRNRLKEILEPAIAVCEHTNRKTLTTLDVVYALRLLGNPIYGFGSIVKGENIHSRAQYARERREKNMKAAREYESRLAAEQREQRIARENRNRAVDAMERAMRAGVRRWMDDQD